MVMETVQVRISKGIIERIDDIIKTGIYSSRSEVIRDAVRGFVIHKMVGIIPNTGDSVKEVREIRKKLAKEKFDLDKINSLAD